MNPSLLIVFFIGLGFVLLTVKPGNIPFPFQMKKFGFASFGMAALILLSESVTIIEPGYVGVPVTFGNVGPQSLPAGMHPIFFLTDVYKMSIQTKNYTTS